MSLASSSMSTMTILTVSVVTITGASEGGLLLRLLHVNQPRQSTLHGHHADTEE